MLADLLDRMTRADQLALGGCVDAVVARAGDGRRGDPEVHLLGTCLADQLDQGAAGGAADDGVVHDHDLLALEHLAHRVELDLHLGHATGLRGVDERPSDIVIADQGVLELDARLLGEPQRHGVGDRKSTRLNSSHLVISYAVFCLKKKKKQKSSQQYKTVSNLAS